MSFEAYKADLSNRYEISHAISVQATAHYNGIGKVTLYLPADDYNINAIDRGGILYDTERGYTWTLQDVVYDTVDNIIIAHGYTCNWLLDKRCITTKRTVTDPAADVYATVSENLRGLPGVLVSGAAVVADAAAEAEKAVLYGGQLMEECIKVLDTTELGHRMVWDDATRTHTFEIYQGRDLTAGIHAVVFSELQGTATNLVMTLDDSTFKNYFYIPCKNKGSTGTEADFVFEYGAEESTDRREHWRHAIESQNTDETEAEFKQRLKWLCIEEEESRLRRQSFEVLIDPAEFGVMYDLGDKVICVSERLGVTFESRITGISYTLDATGEETKIELGEPKLTAIGEAMLKR